MAEEDVMDIGEGATLHSSKDTFQCSPHALLPGPVQPLDSSPTTHTCEEMANMRYTSPVNQQIPMAEYNRQTHYVTQQALGDLKASPEYKKHTMRCHSCGSSWYDGQFSDSCKECSGYAMHRPCPICRGHCEKVWQRNVEMSHSANEGHWDGTCGHQHAARLLKDMIYMDNITDGMQALGTNETKNK